MPASAFSAGGRRIVSGDRFALLGSALGTSTVTGKLSVTRRFDLMQASASGSTSTVARLRTEKVLRAEVAAGRGTLRGEMEPRRFEGVMAGRSTVTGRLLVRKVLRAWPAGQASGEGTLRVEKRLVSNARGQATNRALLRTEKILGGVPSKGVSNVRADLFIEKVLATRAEGHAQAVGTVLVAKRLAGALAGSGTGKGALRVGKELVALSRGSTGVLGALRVAKAFSGPVAGTSRASGTLTTWKRFSGSTSGTAIVVAQMEPPITYRRTQSEDVRATETGDVRQTERDVN